MVGTAAVVAIVAAGCGGGGGGRPTRLLDGRPAAQFAPVPGSVVAAGRVLRLSNLGDADECLAAIDGTDVGGDAPVVERIGVAGKSLTFANRSGSGVYACDGGIDPAAERAPPWCGAVFGALDGGRLADTRLDVLCVDRAYQPLAYAFVEPVAGARWIGVREDGYTELYEALGSLPVRVASTRGIDNENARAALEITEYDAVGRELLRERLEAAVAG